MKRETFTKTLIAAAILFIALAAGAQEFKFVVLGDSRFDNPDVFAGIVREVEILQPDFVIQLGNMIQGYTYDEARILEEWSEFRLMIAPLSMPFHPVPGNHDIGTEPLSRVYGQLWGRNSFHYAFDHKGCRFVVINTEDYRAPGLVGEEQLEWLARDLEQNASRAEHVFIFMHRPLWLYEDSNWGELSKILTKYDDKIRGVYASHRHQYVFEVVDGLRCFIINAAARLSHRAPRIGYFHHFICASVNERGVTEAVIPAGSVKPYDYVTREELERARPYLKADNGGQIRVPDGQPINVAYAFPISNETDQINVYTVRWETPNPAFSATPREQAVLIPPGRTEDVLTAIKAPERDYKYYSLPYALVEIYHETLEGDAALMRSRHSLAIPREAWCRRTPVAPWIDGLLDDTAWQSADLITDFQINKSGDPAEEQTWVRTLYDDEYIYVGAHCSEPNPRNLMARAEGPIPFTFGDDDVELFFDVDHDLDDFARVFSNSAGVTFNSLPGEGLVDKWYDHAAHVGKDYWSLEFRLPLETLAGDDLPTSRTVWGFNARRHRQKPTRVQSDWMKMQNYPYEPWRFGVLKFSP